MRMMDCAIRWYVFYLKAPMLMIRAMGRAIAGVTHSPIARKVSERELDPPLTRMDIYPHPVRRYRSTAKMLEGLSAKDAVRSLDVFALGKLDVVEYLCRTYIHKLGPHATL